MTQARYIGPDKLVNLGGRDLLKGQTIGEGADVRASEAVVLDMLKRGDFQAVAAKQAPKRVEEK